MGPNRRWLMHCRRWHMTHQLYSWKLPTLAHHCRRWHMLLCKQGESQDPDVELQNCRKRLKPSLAHALPSLAHPTWSCSKQLSMLAHASLLVGWISKFISGILIVLRIIAYVSASNVDVRTCIFTSRYWNLDLKFWLCSEKLLTLAHALLSLACAFLNKHLA